MKKKAKKRNNLGPTSSAPGHDQFNKAKGGEKIRLDLTTVGGYFSGIPVMPVGPRVSVCWSSIPPENDITRMTQTHLKTLAQCQASPDKRKAGQRCLTTSREPNNLAQWINEGENKRPACVEELSCRSLFLLPKFLWASIPANEPQSICLQLYSRPTTAQ